MKNSTLIGSWMPKLTKARLGYGVRSEKKKLWPLPVASPLSGSLVITSYQIYICNNKLTSIALSEDQDLAGNVQCLEEIGFVDLCGFKGRVICCSLRDNSGVRRKRHAHTHKVHKTCLCACACVCVCVGKHIFPSNRKTNIQTYAFYNKSTNTYTHLLYTHTYAQTLRQTYSCAHPIKDRIICFDL